MNKVVRDHEASRELTDALECRDREVPSGATAVYALGIVFIAVATLLAKALLF
jgi:hypothetical protein